jgi:hypothetical protein
MESELDRISFSLHKKNKILAEHLLEQQVISTEQLEELLGTKRIPLGKLLIEEGLILKYELKIALLEQQLSDKKLGEILLEQQAISPEQLSNTLRKQTFAHNIH